jgi:hypothetical protein
VALRLRSLKPTEDDIQKQITTGLRLLGYLVLVTSVRVRRCPHCGRPGAGKYGTTPGVPDLLTRGPRWPRYLWAGLEVKRPGGRVRPEQKALAEAGAVAIVTSLDEALAVLQWVEGSLDADS